VGDINAPYDDVQAGNSLRASRILITGASGFLASHLLDVLQHIGCHLIAVYHPSEAPRIDVNADWLAGDLTGSGVIENIIREHQPDIVVHLAARLSAERSWAFADESRAANFDVTHRLMLAVGMHSPRTRRVLLIGSSEEYGNTTTLPVRETCPVNPVSPYSGAKAAASMFATLYAQLFELPVVVLRPFILYGPRQSPSMMIPQLIAHAVQGRDFAMTQGEQTRDFVYVEDAVDAMVRAMVVENIHGEIFNICSGTEMSIRSMAERVMQIMQPTMELQPGVLPYRKNEVWRLFGSNEKAQRMLGWKPVTDIDSGLRKTIAWYRENTVESA
jgi:UDP-glucose 4-epimerase